MGIGANAAIFALMLKNLQVSDPTRLVRLGKGNDCCVGFGFHDIGEFALFSTKTYELMRKNIRRVVVRRENVQQAPRSVMREFVSGNYFHTFGLCPSRGQSHFLQRRRPVADCKIERLPIKKLLFTKIFGE